MSRDNNLPWPLGSTYFDGGTPTSTGGANLEGKIYRADGAPNADGSDGTRWYRVVRNMNATPMGGPTYGQRGYRFGATAGWQGRKIRGIAAAKTDYGVVPDESLTTSCPQYDMCYVSERGPHKVRVASGGPGGGNTATVTFTANKAVAFGRTGGLAFMVLTTDGTAERHPVGTVYESITSGVTGGRNTVVYFGGLSASVVA